MWGRAPGARCGHPKLINQSMESLRVEKAGMYMLDEGVGLGGASAKRSHSTVTSGAGANVGKTSLSALLESVHTSECKKL